jgi:hypothetical protein
LTYSTSIDIDNGRLDTHGPRCSLHNDLNAISLSTFSLNVLNGVFMKKFSHTRFASTTMLIAALVIAPTFIVANAGNAYAQGNSANPKKPAKANSTYQPRNTTITNSNGGLTTIYRVRGADGRIDSTIVGPQGRSTTIDRTADATRTTDAVITGSNGRVSTVDRTRGSDGLVDKTTTGPGGNQWRVNRYRSADESVDATYTNPSGRTTIVNRSR